MPQKPATEPFGYKADGTPICYARLKRGGRCQNTAISRVNFRCRMHSGTKDRMRGINAPNLKTGLYSADLPTRLLGRYEALMEDDTLLSLRNDIALIGAAIGEELEEVKRAEAEPDLEAFIGQAEKVAANWLSWDRTRMDKEMADLIDVAKGRNRRVQAMYNVRSLIRDKANLITAESKLMAERDAQIPVDQVMLILRAIAGAIRRTVKDPDQLREIEGEMARVLVAADARALPSARTV